MTASWSRLAELERSARELHRQALADGAKKLSVEAARSARTDAVKQLEAGQILMGTDPDQAADCFKRSLALEPSLRAAREGLHQVHSRKKPGYVDFAQINIELTNRCCNSCFFCPREQMTRPQGMMSFEDFALAVERINDATGEYCRRVDLHSFGESVFDKALPGKIRYLSKIWPYSYRVLFSSLSMPLQRDHLAALLSSGLNELVISLYAENEGDFRKIFRYDGYANFRKNLSALSELNGSLGSPVLMVGKLPDAKMYENGGLSGFETKRAALVELCAQHGLSIVDTRLSNFGVGRDYNAPSSETVCPLVHEHKRMMVVSWDLTVTPCCWDFNSSMPLGNLRRDTVREIFSSAAYLEFVGAHLRNDLAQYPTCASCDLKFDLEA
jgi:hypothetical protein